MLDRTDINILNALQADASIPLRTLAQKVHVSAATCQCRIARLKADGVLLRGVAIVDRLKVGRALTVFVSVELDRQNDAVLRNFEKKMSARVGVMWSS